MYQYLQCLNNIFVEDPELIGALMEEDAEDAELVDDATGGGNWRVIYIYYMRFYRAMNDIWAAKMKRASSLNTFDTLSQVRMICEYEDEVTTRLLFINHFVQCYAHHTPMAPHPRNADTAPAPVSTVNVSEEDRQRQQKQWVTQTKQVLLEEIRKIRDAYLASKPLPTDEEARDRMRHLYEIMTRGVCDIVKYGEKHLFL